MTARVVYLDSSDFSNFASNADSLDANDHWRGFISARNQQTAVFPFSMVHIAEAMHLSREHRKHSIARVRVIKELSGSCALPSVFDLLINEGIRANSRDGVPASIKVEISETGAWWPTYFSLEDELRQFNKTDIFDETSKIVREETTHLPRRERRKVGSMLRRAKRRGQLQREFLPEAQMIAEEFQRKHGLPPSPSRDDFIRTLVSFERTPHELSRKFMSEFLEIERFIGWYADSYPSIGESLFWARDLGRKIAGITNTFQQQIIDSGLCGPLPEGIRGRFCAATRRGLAQGLHSLCVENKLIEPSFADAWIARVEQSSPTLTPAMSVVAEMVERWVVVSVTNTKTPRRAKDSDGMDILHMAYLPYVDVFKCDKFMHGLVGTLGEQYCTKVVRTQPEVITSLSN